MKKVFVNIETALFEEHSKHKDFSYPNFTVFFAFISHGLAGLVTVTSVPLKAVAAPQVSP